MTKSALKNMPARALTKRFREDESGATAIEYSLIVALIFLAILASVQSFGSTTNEMYDEIESAISTSIN